MIVLMPPDDADPPVTASRKTPWFLVTVALLAASLSVYLAIVSLSASQRPVGCGAGSGCEEVLSSRWSKVLGLPVGWPAAGLYLGMAIAAVIGARTSSGSLQRACSALLWGAAGCILAAVSWFVGLQGIELRAFCPWCLADHGLGVISALAALTSEVRGGRFRPGWFTLGMGLTAALAAVQITLPGDGPAPVPLSARQVELLAGRLQLNLDEVPSLGASTAPPVVVLFDYCCPHCRRTHELLLDELSRAPESFALILLPTPLNADCNPHIEETERPFVAACDLARLALAVWRIDRARFVEFDRWLFAHETARGADDARAEAERLVGAQALAAALRDPWIDARIRAHADAFAGSGVDAIPVLLAPGHGGVSGRVNSAAELRQLLQQELGVTGH